MKIKNHDRTGVRRASLTRAAAKIEFLEARAYFAISFGPPTTIALPPATGISQRPITGDFNNDLKQDVVLPIASPAQGGPAGTLFLATGNGDGTFNSPVQAVTAIFNFEPVAGDFDDDGNLDLAVSDFSADLLHVFTGNGDGTFDADQTFATGDGPFMIEVADFNSDGRTDVAVGNRTSDNVTVRLGDLTSTLGPALTIATADDPVGVLAGDFNGDNNPDLLTGNGVAGPISAFVGNGDGTFTPAADIPGIAAVIDAGDFNNDGKLDLVRGITDAGQPVVTLGNGDLTFAESTLTGGVLQATAGEADGDGNLDLFLDGTLSDQNTVVFPGNGDGTLGGELVFPYLANSLGHAADINSDGLTDHVFLSSAGGQSYSLTTALAENVNPNLVPSVVANPPSSVVGGDKGKLSVRVTNAGGSTFKGSTDIRLLASLDATIDSGDGDVVTVNQALNIKPGKSKLVRLKFDYPTTLPPESYFLLAQVDPSGSAGETPKGDNVGASSSKVTIAPAFIDLAATLPTPLADSYEIGKKGKLTLTLENLGNIPVKGSATIELTASSDTVLDSADTAVAAPVANFNIKAGATKKQRVVFEVPETLAANSYNLFVKVVPSGFTDTVETNNTVLAGQPFVVVA